MFTVQDFENFVFKNVSPEIVSFFKCGAGKEQTLSENKEAFTRLRIQPRYLRDVSRRDLTTTVLGQTMNFPIGISPTAFQGGLHPDGEKATAKGCSEVGSLMIASTSANFSLEEIASSAENNHLWFQMFIFKDREVTKAMVKRAEKSGYKALAVTIDRPIFSERPCQVNKSYDPSNSRVPNFQVDKNVNLKEHIQKLFDPSLTWNDIKWLSSITHLPVVVKGVLTAQDAELAIQYGASAILVSNHGGRQLDGVPATIEALPQVVQAVNGRCDVYLDGGIRTGTDVLKALGLGAKAVFVGRPVLWGLAHSGADGVKEVLTILKNELDVAMALSGCRNIEEIQQLRIIVPHKFYYSS